MLRFESFLLFLVLSLTGLTQVRADVNWSLARDRDGIKVWTREIPDYPIRAFKAEITVKSSLSGLISLIMDTERADKWIYRVSRIDVLRRDDAKGAFLIRVQTDFPWPLTDRDAVVEGLVLQDEKTGVVTIRSHSVSSALSPLHPHFVRMPDMEGMWVFRPLGQGMVEVSMEGRANPGGNIPASVVNLLIHETPYRTLQGLRDVIAAPQYQRALLPQIREF